MRQLRRLIFIPLATTLTSCYLVRAGLHQNDLFNSRRPVSDVIEDPAVSEDVRVQLKRVGHILAFAKDAGLNTEDAYGYYIQTDKPVVSYLVQAAYADRLKSVTWWFPVVGSVPYLGFFEKKDRDEKADELRAQGLDVDEGAAGAFSSLGWFPDPIFSSMLARHETDLAHLFFHELLHRTLWIPGSTAFNENLAEYVAEVLTMAYLEKIGHTEALARYKRKREDRALFHSWLTRLRNDLDALYAQRDTLPHAQLIDRKRLIFARYGAPPLRPQFAVNDYIRGEKWNNAVVLGSVLYTPDVPRFEKAHACVGKNASLHEFLEALKAKHAAGPDDADPFETLDSLCPPK